MRDAANAASKAANAAADKFRAGHSVLFYPQRISLSIDRSGYIYRKALTLIKTARVEDRADRTKKKGGGAAGSGGRAHMRILLLAQCAAAASAALLHPPLLRTYEAHRLAPSSSPVMAAGKGLSAGRSSFTALFPVWSVAAAACGLAFPAMLAPMGSEASFSRGLAVLIFSMGLTITPDELRRAASQPGLLGLNLGCCFGILPFAGAAVSAALGGGTDLRTGTVLLGCVSGGQASNLCALLAGGDVALSVVMTLSSTLLGVALTPLLVRCLLGTAVQSDALALLRSTASLVLAPLVAGVAAARMQPAFAARAAPWCPVVGVAATLTLVVGGAAACSPLLTMGAGAGAGLATHAASILLPVVGGLGSLAVARAARLPERAKRTLVIESVVKSPTLAYVLARRHFVSGAAAVPAASMVWLAAIGATLASLWGRSASPPGRSPAPPP